MDYGRRRLLKGAMATGSLFAPLPYAWVWAADPLDGALKLLKAPKAALVVGNSKYKDAPELRNPANDAKAVGELLGRFGFEVKAVLDASREQLIGAIRDHVHRMEASKAVGLFYFAGHGVQLAWRNYLLPIDAVIDKIDDVAAQSVDIARLMEGLAKAQNAMNIIILDACRENPFGKDYRVERKGLSQMDAPVQTILAYATSPGNVASDGDGANGLYTENLLREMTVPEARIEDVFKRVRLSVRRKTNGAQIPWESTSLEDDFWLQPPRELKKRSEEDKKRQFDEQLATWERIKEANEPGPLEDYLRKYPSGLYAELAQLRLEQVLKKQGEKRIQLTSQEGNPYTKGSATANIGYQVGDSYQYRLVDPASRVERGRLSQTVVRITDTEVQFDSGLVTDLLGNNLKLHTGLQFSPNQTLPLEYVVGKRWETRFTISNRGGQGFAEGEVRVAARETITVPAGTFDTFRIEIRTRGEGFNLPPFQGNVNYWMAPGTVRLQVVRESFRTRNNRTELAERYELVSYKQA